MEIILFLAAAGFSTLGTLAGFGGGIFLIPLMVIAFNIPIEIAIGVTALSLFPSSVISSAFNFRRNFIDFRLLTALEIPTIFGAFLGAQLTNLIPQRPLEFCFSVFLILLSWKMLKPAKENVSRLGEAMGAFNALRPLVVNKEYRVSLWTASLFGTLAGVIAGLFGIGGGILKTPIMIHVFKVPVRTATATAIAMIIFTSFTSGLTHYNLGHVTMNLFVPCAAGFASGGLIGSLIGVKFKDEWIQRIIGVSILFAAFAILL